jgi:glycosyltransferase involved in cell wall biosynthesis
MKLNDMNDTSQERFPGLELSVVVPLYNEEESVGHLVAAICDAHEQAMSAVQGRDGAVAWELILVDDGSLDATVQAANEACANISMPTRVVTMNRNFGQTAAMQAGIDAARGELIATLDGDLQNDPGDIPRMVEHLRANDLDLLVGKRTKRRDGLILRLIPSWIANRLIAKLTGVKISDYGCSLKIYRTSIIRQVSLLGEMHRFIPAWIASVSHPNRIGEVHVNHAPRRFGQSKYGISRTIRVILDLVSVLFFLKFRARPGHFFGSLGLAVGTVGVVMMGVVMFSKLVVGEDIGTRPMFLLGGLALLSALQLVCFGVMAELLTRIYFDSSKRSTYSIRETHGNSASYCSAQKTTDSIREAHLKAA